MNNSFIAIENVSLTEDAEPKSSSVLRARETELIAIIEAIVDLANNPSWLLLQDKIWNGVVDSLKRQRDMEVEKKPLNGPVIHSLNGQLLWAKKFSNILTLAEIYKQELQNIRKTNAKGNSSTSETD